MQRLIGQEVMICATGRRGRISDVDGMRRNTLEHNACICFHLFNSPVLCCTQ